MAAKKNKLRIITGGRAAEPRGAGKAARPLAETGPDVLGQLMGGRAALYLHSARYADLVAASLHSVLSGALYAAARGDLTSLRALEKTARTVKNEGPVFHNGAALLPPKRLGHHEQHSEDARTLLYRARSDLDLCHRARAGERVGGAGLDKPASYIASGLALALTLSPHLVHEVPRKPPAPIPSAESLRDEVRARAGSLEQAVQAELDNHPDWLALETAYQVTRAVMTARPFRFTSDQVGKWLSGALASPGGVE